MTSLDPKKSLIISTYQEGKSIRKIASDLNCSFSGIRRILRKNKIKRRERGCPSDLDINNPTDTNMNKPKKKDNILLRIDNKTHNIIRLKSKLFGRKKSDFLRYCALHYWDLTNNTFKDLLNIYQNGDEEDKKRVVNILFEYYRKTGYPHIKLTDEQKIEKLNRLIKTPSPLLEKNYLQQNIIGISLANFFHPQMVTAKYGGGNKYRTPEETYKNDEYLIDCINRWMELGKSPNPAGVRRILKTRNGTRGVINFKPAISKFIYNTYCPKSGKVLDPCAGYSGRLLGCIAANKNIFYHGIDPDGETALGNMSCASFFSNQYDMFNEREYKYRFRFDLGCAEEIMPSIRECNYDLIFSSPPFFNLEIYSDSYSQSVSRYPEYSEWLEKFLFLIVDESYRILKREGRLILNVKNISKYNIADDLCDYCKEKWLLEETYHMKLANNEYNRKEGKKMFHTEPIFVFSKGN